MKTIHQNDNNLHGLFDDQFVRSNIISSSSSLHRSNSLIRFTHDLSNNYHQQTSTPSICFNNIVNDNNNNNDINQLPTSTIATNDQSIDLMITNLNFKDLIVLSPFDHQVGGHTQIMLLNQYTLCKSLIPRELDFYLNIPRQLNGFVPRYKGVVEICHNESMIPTLYHPNRNFYSKHNNNCNNKPELRVRLSVCNDRRLLESIRGHFEQQRGYGSHFMLLENITSNYHLPCILDLKMGTRQHSDDASDEKRRRQIAKCAATTSATLGIRICGMQVYHKLSNNNNNKYKLYQRDKYHGRRIKNENGLRNELEIYFLNRTYLIRPIISRLKQLKSRIIETLRTTSLRFFSTSLLIVSEGCFNVGNPARKQRLFSDGEEDVDDEFENDDYFYPYDNNITARNGIIDDVDDDDECTSSSLDSMSEESSSYNMEKHLNDNEDILYSCNRDHYRLHRTSTSSKNNNNDLPAFDIRLIDFAHTSFNSSSPSCDYGFILGIDNLIRLLNEILFDAIRARVAMNQQRNNKRRRSSGQNMDNDSQFPHMPSNKKWVINNNNNNDDDHNCDEL
ncbi:hypothetical protein DERF_013640 [Dermatophagoides farinae]|uniref:Kinase n=1 Tax=Dermatophagoides farinae TaxID=6954 RepID=A0A922L0R9_DERFA|nr:hypothetical protein DERF_013640 [Dermatophagoides farinae]